MHDRSSAVVHDRVVLGAVQRQVLHRRLPASGIRGRVVGVQGEGDRSVAWGDPFDVDTLMIGS